MGYKTLGGLRHSFYSNSKINFSQLLALNTFCEYRFRGVHPTGRNIHYSNKNIYTHTYTHTLTIFETNYLCSGNPTVDTSIYIKINKDQILCYCNHYCFNKTRIYERVRHCIL